MADDVSTSSSRQQHNLVSLEIKLVINSNEKESILLEKSLASKEWRCPVVNIVDGEGFVEAIERWCEENVKAVTVCIGMFI